MESPEVIRQKLSDVASQAFDDWVRPYRTLLSSDDVMKLSVAFDGGVKFGVDWAVAKMMEKTA